MNINISLLTLMPNDILRRIVRWSCGPSDASTMCAMFLSCKRLNALIIADWPAISAIYTEVHTYTDQGYMMIQHYFCGRLHRADGPAEYNRMSSVWYHHGRRHRVGDLPAVVAHNKRALSWYDHGLYHRDVDLSADYFTDTWIWYSRGLRHRVVGPAVVEIELHGAAAYSSLSSWDGRSDVSTAEYDWRLIMPASTIIECVIIVRTWYTNGVLVKRERRRLRVADDDGAWVLGQLV